MRNLNNKKRFQTAKNIYIILIIKFVLFNSLSASAWDFFSEDPTCQKKGVAILDYVSTGKIYVYRDAGFEFMAREVIVTAISCQNLENKQIIAGDRLVVNGAGRGWTLGKKIKDELKQINGEKLYSRDLLQRPIVENFEPESVESWNFLSLQTKVKLLSLNHNLGIKSVVSKDLGFNAKLFNKTLNSLVQDDKIKKHSSFVLKKYSVSTVLSPKEIALGYQINFEIELCENTNLENIEPQPALFCYNNKARMIKGVGFISLAGALQIEIN